MKQLPYIVLTHTRFGWTDGIDGVDGDTPMAKTCQMGNTLGED